MPLFFNSARASPAGLQSLAQTPRGRPTTVESGTRRVIERTVIDTDPVTTQTDFDMLGRRLQLTDTRGNVWTWTYNPLDRPRVQVDPDSGRREFTYDDVARTQTERDARGFTLTVSYNTLGRIVSKSPLQSGRGPS